MPVPEFTIGDTVTTASGTKGEIAFGPFKRHSGGQDLYLIQCEDGTARSVLATKLRPVPAFAVGDKVVTAAGAQATVEAGPFTAVSRDVFYVLKDTRLGHHFSLGVRYMTARQDEPADPFASPTYTFAGQTYNLDAEYTDRQGDVWRFNGETEPDGMPLMDCPLYQTFRDHRLSHVVNEYGPLIRS